SGKSEVSYQWTVVAPCRLSTARLPMTVIPLRCPGRCVIVSCMKSRGLAETETKGGAAEPFSPRSETMLRAVGFAAANLLQSNLDDAGIAATLARLAAAAGASRAYIFANELDEQ